MMRKLFVAFMACTLACSGSNGGKSNSAPTIPLPDGRDPKALVAALDSATLAKMELRTGKWSSGDASSNWRAYVADGKVRYINENMVIGKTGSGTLLTYFTAAGQVSSINETRVEIEQHPDRWPSPSQMIFALEFSGDSSGTASKLVNGQSKPVQDFEIKGARNHALELLALANASPAAKRP